MGKKLQDVSQNVRKTEVKKKVGRKPLYTNWINEEGLVLVNKWAEEGLINKLIANKMGVNVATLYEWQDRFPEFADAIKKGKKVIDEQVEISLLKRAIGYQYEEETWGKNHDGEMAIVKRVMKSQAPDVNAQIFWLKNRQPERWRDRVEIKNEHEGTIKVEMGDLKKWSN
ncbi:helix-turn-helix domain-containing protein [Bacillus sp. Cr_A10]|uniref:helix-turn-helix domain-containing protein n=1 Tax=Bacillus sp. Cr_A10 TaxID=3033993 RepID=UPI0023DA4B5F|nr:helix-turn-helix domain-containing protein [Bacillus sp. Cr_A10]MDF2064966.1 helix-turn-helix domain-containing protein [Bacillus sp. Cr_A10]